MTYLVSPDKTLAYNSNQITTIFITATDPDPAITLFKYNFNVPAATTYQSQQNYPTVQAALTAILALVNSAAQATILNATLLT